MAITTTETSNQQEPPIVGSNQGKIQRQHIRWLRPTPRDTPMPEMKKRLQEDGYLFVKQLLPREDVLQVRRDYFSALMPSNILEPGSDPVEGIFNCNKDPTQYGGIGSGDLPPTDLQVKLMTESHTRPEYLNFLEHNDLRSFVRKIMGWEQEVLLNRTMLRQNVPGALSTAVHYDKLFLRNGGAYFLTAWVPIGDISPTGGGLMYLSNSAKLGRDIEEDFTKRAESFSPEERISAFNVNMGKYGMLSQDAAGFHEKYHDHEEDRVWLVSGYEAGDVVFHDPYTIHSSTLNECLEQRIRLSTDLRFYREGSDLDKRWTKTWNPADGLVYESWRARQTVI